MKKHFTYFFTIIFLISCNKPLMQDSEDIDHISEMVLFYWDAEDSLIKKSISIDSAHEMSLIKIIQKSQPTQKTPPKASDFSIEFTVTYADNEKEYFDINVYGSMSYTYITVSNDGKYFRAVKGKYTNNELAIFLTDYVRLLGISI